MSKEADVTKIVDEGLEALPGVSSINTVVPTSDLTPREASPLCKTHTLDLDFLGLKLRNIDFALFF